MDTLMIFFRILSKIFPAFYRKFIDGVVETALYVSRALFWGKDTFFGKVVKFLLLSDTEQQIFDLSAFFALYG